MFGLSVRFDASLRIMMKDQGCASSLADVIPSLTLDLILLQGRPRNRGPVTLIFEV